MLRILVQSDGAAMSLEYARVFSRAQRDALGLLGGELEALRCPENGEAHGVAHLFVRADGSITVTTVRTRSSCSRVLRWPS